MTTLETRKWWALGALTLAVLAVGLDGTVLSVALPTLASALHASEADLQWFSSGYLLVLAAAMLPAGFAVGRLRPQKINVIARTLFWFCPPAPHHSTPTSPPYTTTAPSPLPFH